MPRMIQFYSDIVDHYITGRLYIPSWLVQGLLKFLVEYYYRFAHRYNELKPEWSGSSGAIADKSETLMKVHYDKPRVVFENFLGPTMKYTMALYERGAQNLEEAQEAMLSDICEKAKLQDGHNVLDIACGFGSLSAHILKHYPNCNVTALNLSQVQVNYIKEKQTEAEHPLNSHRFSIVREDFAKAEFGRDYDRIMVVGLFEHIHNLDVSLEKLSNYLRVDGKLFLHFITYNRIIQPMADPSSDIFFDKYIFPGGRFWYFHELPKYDKHLKVDQSWFINGKNYMHTLRAWHQNMWHNIDAIRAHPDVDDMFIRAWDLYLRFCIAAFGAAGGQNLGNGQYLLTHSQSLN